MDRDGRRGRGHWRGCHSLRDHVCDGAGTRYKMHTGLAMGRTYYYYVCPLSFALFTTITAITASAKPRSQLGPPRSFSCLAIASLLPGPSANVATRPPTQYELNGATEMCNPAMPSTTSCPYLPGQKVNTLYIPEEATSRTRRASLSSLSEADFRTMDPRSKFVAPQPAAPSPAELAVRRTGTAAPVLYTDFAFTKDRSLSASSPIKSPWRRFFDRALISRSSESRRRSTNNDDHHSVTSPSSSNYDIRPQTSSEGTRTRDISPASLRRLLVDEIDTSMRPVSRSSLTPSTSSRTPSFSELDQVDEEDDDNFVGTANDLSTDAAEEPIFTTRLSPPPFRRGVSPVSPTGSFAQTVVPSPRSPHPPIRTGEDTSSGLLISPVPQQPLAQLSMPESPILSALDNGLHSACPSSTLSSAVNSPASPTLGEFPSFYDDSQDDDDIDECFPFFSHGEPRKSTNATNSSKHAKVPSAASFSRYCLPPLVFSTDKLPSADNTLSTSPQFTTVSSPLLMPRAGEPVGDNGSSDLLGSSLGSGLGDFASELRWVADSITGRR